MLRPLQPDLKAEIHNATLHFVDSLPGSAGEEYLRSRGIGAGTARAMGLGYIDPANPFPGWEWLKGRISMPYLNMNRDPVWIKARAVPSVLGTDVPKMAQKEGGESRLYNLISLSAPGDTLCLVEGEFDSITLTALGLTAVGIPGASSWKAHYARALQGYTRVVMFHDNDKAGRELAKAVRAKMPDIILAEPPGGYNDVGAAYQAGLGPQIVALAKGLPVPELPKEEKINDEPEPPAVPAEPVSIFDPDGDPPF